MCCIENIYLSHQLLNSLYSFDTNGKEHEEFPKTRLHGTSLHESRSSLSILQSLCTYSYTSKMREAKDVEDENELMYDSIYG